MTPNEPIAYFDDIIMTSCSIEERIDRLRKLLIINREEGLKLKTSICERLVNEIKFLGK